MGYLADALEASAKDVCEQIRAGNLSPCEEACIQYEIAQAIKDIACLPDDPPAEP